MRCPIPCSLTTLIKHNYDTKDADRKQSHFGWFANVTIPSLYRHWCWTAITGNTICVRTKLLNENYAPGSSCHTCGDSPQRPTSTLNWESGIGDNVCLFADTGDTFTYRLEVLKSPRDYKSVW